MISESPLDHSSLFWRIMHIHSWIAVLLHSVESKKFSSLLHFVQSPSGFESLLHWLPAVLVGNLCLVSHLYDVDSYLFHSAIHSPRTHSFFHVVNDLKEKKTFHTWNWQVSLMDWMGGDPPVCTTLATKGSAPPLVGYVMEAFKFFHLPKKWWGETWEENQDSRSQDPSLEMFAESSCTFFLTQRIGGSVVFRGNTSSVTFSTWPSLTSLSLS